MKFYTSVERFGNNILYRGYEHGKAVARKERFMPTLYLQTPQDSVWKTLEGYTVKPVIFEEMREASDFIKRYEHVDHVEEYGMNNFVFQYITNQFPSDIEFDYSLINVLTIDLEVQS